MLPRVRFVRLLAGILCAAMLFGQGSLASTRGWDDLSGVRHNPFRALGRLGTVLIFVAHDCPLCNRYAPEIARIEARYRPRGFRFWRVYAEPGVTRSTALHHAAAYGYRFPALLDPSATLARRAGAKITPQAAVYTPDGRQVYLGRIDDRAIDLARERPAPTRFDLRDTLDALVAGRPVQVHSTPAIGCFISGTGS